MEDASLDEFLNGEDSDDGSDAAEESGSDAETESGSDSGGDHDHPGDNSETPVDPAAAGQTEVEPAQTTHQWAPDGVPCDACGREVQRRWASDEGLVCPDCKDW